MDKDGCNELCEVETDFICFQKAGISACSYAEPIEFELVSFTKDPYCNCLIFKLNVYPVFRTLEVLNFIEVLEPNLPLFNGSFVYENGSLTLKYEYNETLEGKNLTFFFFPYTDSRFEETPGSTIDMQLILPTNEPIVVYEDEVYHQR